MNFKFYAKVLTKCLIAGGVLGYIIAANETRKLEKKAEKNLERNRINLDDDFTIYFF